MFRPTQPEPSTGDARHADAPLPFGRLLRRTRKRKGMAQFALAARMVAVGGRHDGSASVESLAVMISKWENCKMEPDQYNRHLLAAALEVSVTALGLEVDPDFYF
jgi:transcriptional regulator with XRE-family HTH domain